VFFIAASFSRRIEIFASMSIAEPRDKLTGCGTIRYGVSATAIRTARFIRLKPEVIDVFLSLGTHFSCVETSLFVS
jgi:hypothetical protein